MLRFVAKIGRRKFIDHIKTALVSVLGTGKHNWPIFGELCEFCLRQEIPWYLDLELGDRLLNQVQRDILPK